MSEYRNPHVLCEWQRDWARAEKLNDLAAILEEHGGSSGVAFDWEMQLPGVAADQRFVHREGSQQALELVHAGFRNRSTTDWPPDATRRRYRYSIRMRRKQ